MLVSGETLRDEHVELLAGLVGGELGQRLRAALAHNASIMTLSRNDRERMLASLDDAPWPLLGLRETMRKQLRGRRRREKTQNRVADYNAARGWLENRGHNA
jgi:hypothetical protein